jgi:dTDP-4-amino-4,6-dideoxygalactose transaminase
VTVAGLLGSTGSGVRRSRPDVDRVIPLGTTQMGVDERAAVDDVIERRAFYRYHGSRVVEFEHAFGARLLAGQRCLAVNSGSSALQIAFAALDEEPGFEVLVPVLGYVAAATAVVAAGGVPRFVPVDATLGLDVNAAPAFVTPRTRAVLAVHFQGAACDTAGVGRLADEFGLHVVEDVAQACGGSYAGRPLGTHGTVAAFSFQHFKLLSTGEGGLVTSVSGPVLDRAQCLHDAASPWVAPDVLARVPRLRVPPTNLRMSELEGALGLAQLSRVPGWISRLRTVKHRLCAELAGIAAVTARPVPDPAGDIGSAVTFRCSDAASAERVIAGLRTAGVNAGPLLGPGGTNRHFAGDWTELLQRCGIDPAPPDVIADARRRFAPLVVINCDLRWTDVDVEETAAVLAAVLRDMVATRTARAAGSPDPTNAH